MEEIILDRLWNIVSFELSNNNQEIKIEECCDFRYKDKLNKTEFAQLIAELQVLHNKMI